MGDNATTKVVVTTIVSEVVVTTVVSKVAVTTVVSKLVVATVVSKVVGVQKFDRKNKVTLELEIMFNLHV